MKGVGAISTQVGTWEGAEETDGLYTAARDGSHVYIYLYTYLICFAYRFIDMMKCLFCHLSVTECEKQKNKKAGRCCRFTALLKGGFTQSIIIRIDANRLISTAIREFAMGNGYGNNESTMCFHGPWLP